MLQTSNFDLEKDKGHSRLLVESKAKSEYKNPLTGKKVEWQQRQIKNKKIKICAEAISEQRM